jgi:hypothetical protein
MADNKGEQGPDRGSSRKASGGSRNRAQTSERTAADKAERARPDTVDISATDGGELAAGAVGQAAGEIRALGAEAASPGPLGVGEAAGDSDVTNELSGGGVAFGEFTKSVGLAVAAAQAELDKTLVETAKELSKTKINTVAVFEQQVKDDDGTMEEGVVHIQELPMSNYLMPTAYQWSRVYLEADMNVQEFNSRSGFNIQQKSFSADARLNGNAGTFGWGVSGSAGFSYGQSSTGVDASYGQDVAAGKLHMEATLEPRGDVELPRPFVLQKGPRMQLLVGAREPIHEENDATKPVVGQKVSLKAALQKTDGSKMDADKPLSLNISDSSLNYKASGKTDANGEMAIEITRSGAAYDPTTPVRAMVRVSFGLVSQSVGVVL